MLTKEIHLMSGAVLAITESDALALLTKGLIFGCGDHYHFADVTFDRNALEAILEAAGNSDAVIFGTDEGASPIELVQSIEIPSEYPVNSISDIFASIMKGVEEKRAAAKEEPAAKAEASTEDPGDRFKRRLQELNAYMQKDASKRQMHFDARMKEFKAEARAGGLTDEDILKALLGSLADGVANIFKPARAA